MACWLISSCCLCKLTCERSSSLPRAAILLQITRRVPGRRLRAVALRRDVKQRCFHSMLALSQVDDELLQAPRLAIRALRARPELALLALEQQLRALELAELRLEQRRADFETALLLREAHAFRVELCSAALEFCLLGLDARFGARLCAPRFVALALPTALTRLARGKRATDYRDRARARGSSLARAPRTRMFQLRAPPRGARSQRSPH